MKKNRITTQVAAAAAFLFLCWAPGLTHAQESAPAPAQTPRLSSPASGLKKDTHQSDDFAGLTYTPEQQAKIDQIRQTAKQRIDAVKEDEKLAPDVKQAMLDGYQRIEINELYQVLTPEQQKEVRKKALARRTALQQAELQKKQNRPPAPQ
jgi:Spy/CpxP family protein refolding chaperone